MKRITTFIVFLLSLAGATFAQSAIVPLGGDTQSNSGSVSYTVGQIAVENAANSKQLQSLMVTDDLTALQIGQYATGTYYLELRDGKRVLKTFKVVRK